MTIKPFKLSIIIPVYNTGNYIENSFFSIINASDFNERLVEIIFIDDHSDWKTKEILNKFKTFNYVKVVTLKEEDKHGAGNARNVGMSFSSGNFYYFMDADDRIQKNFFKVVFSKILNAKFDVLTFGFEMVSAETNKVLSKSIPDSNRKIAKNEEWEENLLWYFDNVNVFSVWTKVYSASFLAKNNLKFPDLRTAQDAIFNLKMLAFAKSILVLDEKLYSYLVNRPGSNQTLPKSKFENEYNVLTTLKSLFSSFNSSDWERIYYRQMLEILTHEYKFALYINKNPVSVNINSKHVFFSLANELNNYYFKKINRNGLKNYLRSFFFMTPLRINLMGWFESNVRNK